MREGQGWAVFRRWAAQASMWNWWVSAGAVRRAGESLVDLSTCYETPHVMDWHDGWRMPAVVQGKMHCLWKVNESTCDGGASVNGVFQKGGTRVPCKQCRWAVLLVFGQASISNIVQGGRCAWRVLELLQSSNSKTYLNNSSQVSYASSNLGHPICKSPFLRTSCKVDVVRLACLRVTAVLKL